jgi:aldehyde dehydrogenase
VLNALEEFASSRTVSPLVRPVADSWRRCAQAGGSFDCLARVAAIRQGDPLDTDTMIGPRVSAQQVAKIASYVDISRDEGAEVLIGGVRPALGSDLSGGYYFEPTVLKGHNSMRVFQEEIFGPVLAVTNCYHQYPAGAAFGGYKVSGISRENHRMMLDHYSQTKNLMVSYSTKPLGFF